MDADVVLWEDVGRAVVDERGRGAAEVNSWGFVMKMMGGGTWGEWRNGGAIS